MHFHLTVVHDIVYDHTYKNDTHMKPMPVLPANMQLSDTYGKWKAFIQK